MHIKLNGKDESIKEGLNLLDFLECKDIKKDGIVVVLNENVVRKENFKKVILKDRDNVEILRFVAGG